ncbi:MAG: hypothetical protein LBG10_00345 [Treponema sp.]|jgi:hypothetical protein|nr:hypothetical protein [Treponema sp.]
MRRIAGIVLPLLCAAALWAEPDVYVVGQERTSDGTPVVCIWKNGQKTAPLGAKDYSGATAIAVSGNDVYVAGCYHQSDDNPNNRACY